MPLPPVPAFSPVAHAAATVIVPGARFTVLADRLIRMEHSRDQVFEDRPSQVFWHRAQPVPPFTTAVTIGVVEIETEYLRLRYRPTSAGFARQTLTITLKQNGRTWRYGDSARGAGNLKGTARTLDGDAGSTPLEDGLLSRAGWALVDDSQSLVFNAQGWLEPRGRRQPDLYFFGYGPEAEACLGDFTRVAGAVPLIPRFILGNWWSRYWAYTQAELQSLMEDFRRYDLPLSVCIVDMDWHITKTGNASNGWTGYTWNRALFPDPPAFVAWLHQQGLRTALNLHPARGVFSHEEQYADMARWMGLDPAGRRPILFDLTNPRFAEGYFEILHHPQEAMGIDFWWLDWQQGHKTRLPGLDPLWWLNHLHFQDLGRGGRKRPFIFSRWGGLGNHRYPIGFSGDTLVRWRALAYQPYFTATASNVAYGWWSHDIGGHFWKDLTPELYLRWVQFGVFSPIFRLHSTNRPELDRRPWSKPERIFRAAREAMQLRHALIPYLYTMAWRAHRTGLPLITPMYYGNMSSKAAFSAKDQYFFGSELVAAPFLRPADAASGLAERKVWLPEGRWYNFFTGAELTGNRWHTVSGALEDIPVFARAGAIVPLAPKTGWGGLENPRELDVFVFPGATRRFDLYEDDGETTDYTRGEYSLTPLSVAWEPGSLTFTVHPVEGDTAAVPSERLYRIHLRGVAPQTSADQSGQYEAATQTYSVAGVTVKPGESLTLTFKVASARPTQMEHGS